MNHFDIARSGGGIWRVQDREGMIGGIFRTREDAVRFAMFEADWDRRRVHFLRTEAAASLGRVNSGKHRPNQAKSRFRIRHNNLNLLHGESGSETVS